MTIEFRPITEDEFPAFGRAASFGFGSQPSDEDTALQRRTFELDRSLAAIDAGAFVGTAEIYTFDMTVPGHAAVPAAGVTWITVSPTHRRRGILTSMMRRQFEDMRERNEPLAILYASESMIYGRFGYGVATVNANYTIETARGAYNRAPESSGRLRVLDKDEARASIPEVYERFRLTHPGALSRTEQRWDNWFEDPERWRDGATPRFYLVYEGPGGEIEGYAPYRIRHKWENGLPDSTLSFTTMIALNLPARAALWRFALDVDLMGRVVANGFPSDEPIRWMLAEPRRLRATDTYDALWLRLVDIPTALEARRYATEDHLVFRVTDRFLPENDGCYELTGSPDGATCRKTRAQPDLSLGVDDLGSIYLGGIRCTSLGAAGRVEEHTPGACLRADLLFASAVQPWCPFDF